MLNHLLQDAAQLQSKPAEWVNDIAGTQCSELKRNAETDAETDAEIHLRTEETAQIKQTKEMMKCSSSSLSSSSSIYWLKNTTRSSRLLR